MADGYEQAPKRTPYLEVAPTPHGSNLRHRHTLSTPTWHSVAVFTPRRTIAAKQFDGAKAGTTGFESYWQNHLYDEEEIQKLAKFENADYLVENNQPFREWTRQTNSDPTKQWDRWVVMVLVGFSVGLTGFVLHQLIDSLGEIKYELASDLLEEKQYFWAWLMYALVSCGFAFVSALIVLFISPAAAGSGLPEVIAHLNGTVVPHFFSVRTFIAKFLSCALAVSSGLPVGPEGPMITLGAVIGRGVSGMSSKTLGLDFGVFRRLRNPSDRRDFVSAGAGAGVSSAFGAPVGGLLFTMEEVSSFWNQILTWQIFFTCMISSFVTDALNACVDGSPGLMGGILFQVKNFDISYHVLLCIPGLILGVIGGVLGTLFTFLNLKFSRFRATYIVPRRWARILDPVLTALVLSFIVVFLPAAFSCTTCPDATTNRCYDQNFGATQAYTCHNTTAHYNEMASLYLQSGHHTIRRLFTRETYNEFGYGALIAMLVTYFPLACWSAGSVLSTGIVVPMLLIGALYGRVLGVIFVDIFGSRTNGDWDWIDPGIFALIGAASFFAGVSRLTMTLAVIMVELSMDVNLLVPIMLSVIVAKSIADTLTHSLYHALIELKCMPFLDHIPGTHESLELHSVRTITEGQTVCCLKESETVANLLALLHTSTHNKFAVVKEMGMLPNENTARMQHPDWEDDDAVPLHPQPKYDNPVHTGRFVGSIRRDVLELLIQNKHFADEPSTTAPTLLSFPTLMKHRKEGSAHMPQELPPAVLRKFVNLAPYVDQSAITVLDTFSLARAYTVFRTMGLRHLWVLSNTGRVVGVLTRKDLMGFSIQFAIDQRPAA